MTQKQYIGITNSLSPNSRQSCLFTVFAAFFIVFCSVLPSLAQIPAENPPISDAVVIEQGEVRDADVFGTGKSVVIRGTVKRGVMSFGGNVIVEGRVEGDVASVGGSVIQMPQSFIGGDVIVLGGSYKHGKSAPLRNPHSNTVMYAGYEEELRALMLDPTSMFAPSFSAAYLVQKVLSVLFWFVVSLVLTAIAPGAIGRSAARLRLSTSKIALAGIASLFAATASIALGVVVLPTFLSVVIGLMFSISILLAYVFGRVVLQAVTGNYLHKLIAPKKRRSEAWALFGGSLFWSFALSLPFIWTFFLIVILMFSLGLVLTAREKI